MPTRKEFDLASELYEEAVALYEAAKAEFEEIEKMIKATLANRGSLTHTELAKEEAARAKLFVARVRLSRHEDNGKRRY